jgi:NADH-quinone oxidoreductase subunit I
VSSPESSHRWIRLIEPACTSCMICARECPTWCISIDSHTEPIPDLPATARERTQNVLDRFAIDWSLCMYCGICVEECPFDALEWVDDLTQPALSSDALIEEMAQPPES